MTYVIPSIKPNPTLEWQPYATLLGDVTVALDTKIRCGVFGCDRPVWARGLCDTHLSRLRRHGHLEPTRATDWGERRRHPLYGYWKQIKRNRKDVCDEWASDFWAFARAVGDRPSPDHKLWRSDKARLLGPDNAFWTISKAGPARDVMHSSGRMSHRAYMAEWQRKRRAADPFHQFRIALKTYGLTLDQYEVLLEQQGGVCAICLQAERRRATANGTLRRLCVDHDHQTGKVRGLLCAGCNNAIGYLADNPTLLRRAIRYLEGV